MIGGGDDAFGFGAYPGQFGMAVYSRYPIDPTGIRTFQKFLWKDMPGAKLPDDPATPAPKDWYSPAEQAVFRLSSKSHWDLPVVIGGRVVHFLTSHPTPPVFDGPEDRNGTRNFDEIRLWADYITPWRSDYIYDDGGRTGGLKRGARFVIAGDQNSDPLDGDSIPGAIQQLLDHNLVNTRSTPTSPGAVEQNALQGGANLTHKSDPKFDTADFADSAPGNLRADYVLPRKNMQITGSGVFWPLDGRSALPARRRLPVPDLRPPPRLGGREGAGRGRRGRQLARATPRLLRGLLLLPRGPASWQSRQRASYCSLAPTTIVAPEYGAGRPSTSRCVVVAGPPQRWQTAWSLSTNSAWASSSGIGPNGSRRKSWSSPATITRAPPSASASAAPTTSRSKNWTSSIPTTSMPRARSTSSATSLTGTARMRMPAWLTTSEAS